MADDPIRAALREADQAMAEYFGPPHPSPCLPLAAAAIAAFLRAPGMWAALAEDGTEAVAAAVERAARQEGEG